MLMSSKLVASLDTSVVASSSRVIDDELDNTDLDLHTHGLSW